MRLTRAALGRLAALCLCTTRPPILPDALSIFAPTATTAADPPPSLLDPPRWVTTENGAALKKQSDANTKLKDKAAQRVLDQGIELAARGADEEAQTQDDSTLAKAEDRFTLLIEELAPNYAYGYTNRGNVRVARGNFNGAVEDYSKALELAPLAPDAWVILLNRGSTLLAIDAKRVKLLGSGGGSTSSGSSSDAGDNGGVPAPNAVVEAALTDMQRSVDLSKADRLALLGRGSAFHRLGRYPEATKDYGAVLDMKPADIQPFWLRYALELAEVGRRTEGLGIARRLVAKFDIEPESNLAVCSLLWKDGTAAEREEALKRFSVLPVPTRQRMAAIDFVEREWPSDTRAAAKEFLFRAASGQVVPAPL